MLSQQDLAEEARLQALHALGLLDTPREDRFDRFTRLRPEAGGGSGLGLALVAALVRGRGGTATAGATPSGGARLEIRWPTPTTPEPRTP